jgi:DNA-binding transcriptional MerR regulator/methylmalonyl-CoA mutase cobalamin-binding subunit
VSRYRIRNVSQLSGVSTATLRAWERRYGVPSPARTASAYRLYSDADVALIKRMRDLVSSGVAAAEAARAVTVHGAAATSAPITGEEVDPFGLACDRIVEATTRFDPEALELAVSRTLTLGPAVTIFDRAIGPALRRIGDLWHEGSVTIAQEHLASQVMMGALIDLLRLAQPAEASRRVALACFADEDHILGLYGMALRFASWGFRTVVIGARTPPSAVARIVGTLAPDVVALSVTIAPAPPRTRELVDGYADACQSTPWIVGGHAADGMRAWIEARGGMVAGADAMELRRNLDRALLQKKRRSSGEDAG